MEYCLGFIKIHGNGILTENRINCYYDDEEASESGQ